MPLLNTLSSRLLQQLIVSVVTSSKLYRVCTDRDRRKEESEGESERGQKQPDFQDIPKARGVHKPAR